MECMDPSVVAWLTTGACWSGLVPSLIGCQSVLLGRAICPWLGMLAPGMACYMAQGFLRLGLQTVGSLALDFMGMVTTNEWAGKLPGCVRLEGELQIGVCQCQYPHSSCLVTESCLTFCKPVDSSPLGSSLYYISLVRTLEWVVISLSRGSSWPRDWTWLSCIDGLILYYWAMREAFVGDEHPKMNSCIICVPIGSFYCLLPLWEALLDQQEGLTQALFKLLPLCCDMDHVRFCISLLQSESLYLTALLLLHTQCPMASEPCIGWGAQCRTKCRSKAPCPRGESLQLCLSSFVSCLPRMWALLYRF